MDKTERFAEARRRLLDEIAAEVAETASYLDRDRLQEAVMRAIAAVPRHEFVPGALQSEAYENRPLPIGQGQTISQPFIVAVMTDMLALAPDDRVLEIGTGCGYQAAVLGRLAARVDTVETLPELYETAKARLAALGCTNVHCHLGDGWLGWPEAAPYDAVIATAAAPRMPEHLLEQLAPGGRMAIPIGPRTGPQWLHEIGKDRGGRITDAKRLPVAFVPMVEG